MDVQTVVQRKMTLQMTEKNTAIEKALDILTSFIPNNTEVGTLDISSKLGFHRATASRILLTLSRRGFLHQDAATKKFKLGRTALDLGSAVIHALRTNIVHLARPYIDQLRTDLGTSVLFEQLVNYRAMITYVSEGPHRINVAGNIGDCVSINAAAGAKAMLAFSDSPTVERVIARNPGFEAMTPNTITHPDIFKAHLREIRHNGYSLDNEEIDIGIKAIGAPIFDCQQKPVAGVAVAFPAYRLGTTIDPDIIKKITRTAETISAVLLMDNNRMSG